jgi:hypothetical protein
MSNNTNVDFWEWLKNREQKSDNKYEPELLPLYIEAPQQSPKNIDKVKENHEYDEIDSGDENQNRGVIIIDIV